MRYQGLITAAASAIVASSVSAATVETSLRPQIRPGSGYEPGAFVVITDVPANSIRPVLRPEADTPQIIRVSAADQDFDRWIKRFRPRALSAGISAAVFDRAFRNVRYNADVVHKDRNQSEFKQQIWNYLDNAVSPVRVENGEKALRQHAATLRRIEQRYGVEKEVVVAVWGLESTYGARRGNIPLIEAVATLAYDGRRGAFFEKQLIAALKILQSGDTTPENMKGSWAGAMGHTQFIPTSYQAYAVDFTGDGRRDIWSDDPTDALASTAAYLSRFKWKKGQPWGVEVRLPNGFNPAQAQREIKKAPSEWAALGVKDMQGKPVPNHGRAAILLPAGTKGAAFMIFNNFAVIEKYNHSDAYVMGVGHLSDRLSGGPPILGSWPRGYKPLSFDEKKEVQRRLKRKGFAVEKVDGLIGPNTVNAIIAFQRSIGVEADGFPSQTVLKQLKR